MLKAYFWLIFCIVMWGSNFVFGKILVQEFSPSMLTMLRLLFIVLFLGVIASFKSQSKRISKADWPMILLLGIVGVFINQWTFFVGLQTADTTLSALILATTPILTGFLAAIFLKEKVTTRMVLGSVIAIIGVFFVVAQGSTSGINVEKGLLWIVITMITFAIMIIITRGLSDRMDPLTITLYSNVVGFMASIPFALLLDNPIRVSGSAGDWFFLIGTAIAVHGIATLIWNNNIRHVGAAKASMLSNLEPFVAMIAGLILLLKPITTAQILGSLLIVAGVMLSTYQRRKHYRRSLT